MKFENIEWIQPATPRIGFDLDGVVMNSSPAFESYFWTKFGFKINETNNLGYRSFQFNTPDTWDWNRLENEIHKCIIEYSDYILPEDGSDVALRKWYSFTDKKPITFVTARSEKTEQVTRKWLNEWLGISYNIIMMSSWSGLDKVEYIKDRFDYFVDDRFKTCEELSYEIKNVFCVNQEWNRGRRFKNDNVIRVKNLHEVIDYFRYEGWF